MWRTDAPARVTAVWQAWRRNRNRSIRERRDRRKSNGGKGKERRGQTERDEGKKMLGLERESEEELMEVHVWFLNDEVFS